MSNDENRVPREKQFNSVMERLERVDRENWRLKSGMILTVLSITVAITLTGIFKEGQYSYSALALVGIIAAMTIWRFNPKVAKVVEAESFVLRDSNGKRRATLAESPDGSTVLLLFNRNGDPRLTLAVGPDGLPKVQLQDNGGGNRASMGLAADGSPVLGLVDEKGKIRVVIAAGRDDSRNLSLFDKDGIPRVTLDVASDGTPSLELGDKDGKISAKLEVKTGQPPALAFYDKQRARAVFGLTVDELPALAFYDETGTIVWSAEY